MKNPHDLSNLEFAALMLQERLDKLQNPNTPMAQKLRLAINELKFLDQKEKTTPKNWWFVQYIGDEGQHVRADDLIPQELQRIGKMLNRRDYASRWETFKRGIAKTEYWKAMEPEFKPKPTGYVKDSLLAAIWSIRQATHYSTDFRKAVENAVNLGGDADTIGAITGGLAGALCGFNRIPESWVNALDDGLRNELDRLALLAELERERAKQELDNADRR